MLWSRKTFGHLLCWVNNEVRDIKLENRLRLPLPLTLKQATIVGRWRGLHTPGSDPKRQGPPSLWPFLRHWQNNWIYNGVKTARTGPKFFSGSKIGETWKPYAACYGGHQFGQWAGQLGDGRAINLGELSYKDRPCHPSTQRSRPTPYSRNADGFAVLHVRRWEIPLPSEAMYFLGIPTTRALCLVATGSGVARHDVRWQCSLRAGAVVCRVAPDFIRFGNFEILLPVRSTNYWELWPIIP